MEDPFDHSKTKIAVRCKNIEENEIVSFGLLTDVDLKTTHVFLVLGLLGLVGVGLVIVLDEGESHLNNRRCGSAYERMEDMVVGHRRIDAREHKEFGKWR